MEGLKKDNLYVTCDESLPNDSGTNPEFQTIVFYLT